MSAAKLAGILNRTAAVVFLGGNVAGGIVNLGTGSLELFKEAVAGEHYDLKSLTRAHKFYFSDIIENSWDGASGKLYS